MAQIIRITSEALQATIRRLLPSQVGFGEDLQASNVITPIIDLTPTAEGSALPLELSSAVSFVDANEFSSQASSATIANTPGFWRVTAHITLVGSSTATKNIFIRLNDGTTTKNVDVPRVLSGAINNEFQTIGYDKIFFLRTGDTLSVETGIDCIMRGSARQVADVNGNIQNPTGFSFE